MSEQQKAEAKADKPETGTRGRKADKPGRENEVDRRTAKALEHEDLPDTPSGYALQQVGNEDGEDVDDREAAAAHGEEYLYEKRKRRWGFDEKPSNSPGGELTE